MGLKKWVAINVLDRFMRSTQDVFVNTYRTRGWGDGESVSGGGSTVVGTNDLRTSLPPLVIRYGVKRFLDAPCGDLNWMSSVSLAVDQYFGADIVPDLVERLRGKYSGSNREFLMADICVDALPKVDMIMCRDCLIHLPFRKIRAALANFRRSGSTYLLTNYDAFVKRNEDIPTGHYRPLNLTAAPFSLPEPIEKVRDGELTPAHTALAGAPARWMGLWELQDLPI
jgi:SAM-dependent methyltransferase